MAQLVLSWTAVNPSKEPKMMQACWIYSTTHDEAEAAAIGEILINENLAACVNILPKIRSIYRWQGQIHKDQESAMLIKICKDKFETVRARIRELHSYQTPCIIAVDWDQVDTDYLKWIISPI
jgi:periplasmic divalent cation tolerance protein